MTSSWQVVDLFIHRSNASGRAYAVGVAIAALGNRHADGWTFAKLDLIARLSRLDRKTANLGIRDLENLGELEYERGRSFWNPSRYRIRVDVLRSGRDRSQRDVTMDESPTVTMDESPTVTMDESPTVTMDESPMVTMVNPSLDHGKSVPRPWTNRPRSLLTESLTEPLTNPPTPQGAVHGVDPAVVENFTASWNASCDGVPDIRKPPKAASKRRLMQDAVEYYPDRVLLEAAIRRFAADDFNRSHSYGFETFCRHLERWSKDAPPRENRIDRDIRESVERGRRARGDDVANPGTVIDMPRAVADVARWASRSMVAPS